MIVIFAPTLSWNRNPNWMRQRQDRRCPSQKVFTCGFGRKSARNRTDSRGCLTSALFPYPTRSTLVTGSMRPKDFYP
jgi:hypothetical protein